jgi:hypothetical protein
MIGSSMRDRQAAARYERIFREARRQFDQEVRAIFAKHAADGLLRSGKTIKVVVRALDEVTLAAIDGALAGISAVTEHAGRPRKKLLELLTASLTVHHGLISEKARDALIQIDLTADFKHALPLIEVAKVRHRERIADFGEGWTAPVGKPWKDRHPILFALLIALIGAMVGLAGKAAFERSGAIGEHKDSLVAP